MKKMLLPVFCRQGRWTRCWHDVHTFKQWPHEKLMQHCAKQTAMIFFPCFPRYLLIAMVQERHKLHFFWWIEKFFAVMLLNNNAADTQFKLSTALKSRWPGNVLEARRLKETHQSTKCPNQGLQAESSRTHSWLTREPCPTSFRNTRCARYTGGSLKGRARSVNISDT